MAATLAKSGFYVDDFNKLRILDPSVAQSTVEFKEECSDFVHSNFKYLLFMCIHIMTIKLMPTIMIIRS